MKKIDGGVYKSHKKEFTLLENINLVAQKLSGVLTKKEQQYSSENFLMGCTQTSKIHFADLTDIYANLLRFIDTITSLAPTITYGSTVPGFAISCVQPTELLLIDCKINETAIENTEHSNVGFYIMHFDHQKYSCIGGNNPKMGYDLMVLLKQSLQDIGDIKRTLDFVKTLEKLIKRDKESLMSLIQQIENEEKDVICIRELITDTHSYIKGLIQIAAPIRNEAFRKENEHLFKKKKNPINES